MAELLEAPVTSSLEGKSAFPEDHPLSLGAGSRAIPKAVRVFLDKADVVFGIGCSFGATNYGVRLPRKGPEYIQATLDPADLNKDLPIQYALIGDADLTLRALINEVRDRLKGQTRGRADAVAAEIASLREEWLAQWKPKLGLAMGAKLARPDKLCINVWGDAAIGFTGMDFETAVRERIPILSILLNNFSMAIELKVMAVATEKYRSTDISGNYADMARAFGGYGERVTAPDQIVPAIQRGIAQTREGHPALLEFITQKETQTSDY